MQAHVRHVEKFTNFMSPVGLSISHYNGSNPRSKHGRQRFQHLTNPPNVTGNVSGSGSGSDSEHGAPQNNSNQHSQQIQHSTTLTVSNVNRITKSTQRRANVVNLEDDNDDIKVQTRMNDSQWARENLSLRHTRNRQLYFEADSNSSNQSKDVMNQVLDRLVIYGYETSADIAKMQPWQLRVLKKEIPQIDFIFMTAYRMWGKQEYYDDHQNLAFRQYWDASVWLQYNEIELIIKCFDAPRRGYQCMICGTTHGLYELDQVRWHIWLEHKKAPQLNAIMQASKRHNDYNFAKPMENLQLPSLERGRGHSHSPACSHSHREKSQSQTEVISLLDDSTDDEMETKKQRTRSSPQKRGRYLNKGRQYNSRRSGGPDNDSNTTNNTQQRRRRSRRLQNKNGNHNDNETIQQPNPIQNPIIINGVDDDLPSNYNQEEVMEIHGSQSPAFMPSAHYNQQQSQNNNGSSTILDTMNTMKNNSNYSLDTHDTVISNEMEMDDGNDYYDTNDNDNNHNHNHMNNNNTNSNQSPEMQMDDFHMIGFNDDFTTLGVMGALSRNSSDSFNGLNLNSAFTDNNFVQLNLH